jgi:hypothetical protein
VPEPHDPPAGRFLGVRLTSEEEARLESFRAERGLDNRSEAVRALLKDAAPSRARIAELPATRLRELEELVANHRDGLPELRKHAREMRERGEKRRRAVREGRELLRR